MPLKSYSLQSSMPYYGVDCSTANTAAERCSISHSSPNSTLATWESFLPTFWGFQDSKGINVGFNIQHMKQRVRSYQLFLNFAGESAWQILRPADQQPAFLTGHRQLTAVFVQAPDYVCTWCQPMTCGFQTLPVKDDPGEASSRVRRAQTDGGHVVAQLGVRHVLSKGLQDVQQQSTAKTSELRELSHLRDTADQLITSHYLFFVCKRDWLV